MCNGIKSKLEALIVLHCIRFQLVKESNEIRAADGIPALVQPKKADLAKAFQLADVDNSGGVDLAEFRTLCKQVTDLP